jgi:hypothetical protein
MESMKLRDKSGRDERQKRKLLNHYPDIKKSGKKQ